MHLTQLSSTQLVIDLGKLIIALTGADICLDLIVLAMPLFVIKNLHTTRETDIYAPGTFLFGAL